MSKTPTTSTRTPLSDPLDPRAIAALVAGRHGSPFDALGPRLTQLGGQSVWIVRAFLPGAQAAWVIPDAPLTTSGKAGAANGKHPPAVGSATDGDAPNGAISTGAAPYAKDGASVTATSGAAALPV